MNKLKSIPSTAFKIAGLLGYAGCIVHCILEHVADFVICTGPSMEPTLFSHHIVITERFSVRQRKIHRGDIVIFKNPYNPRHHLCKRIRGMPGDEVHCVVYSEVIPKGYVWVEGDNKKNSTDSRFYGPVPQGLIRGRVACIIWPLSRIKLFNKDEYVEDEEPHELF